MTRRDWESVSGLHTVLRLTPMIGFIVSAIFMLVFGYNEDQAMVALTSLALAVPVLFITTFTEIWIDQKVEDAKEATEK